MEDKIIEIQDDENLLRRAFFTDPQYVREDMTVTSFAFKLRKNETGLSVDIESLTTYAKSIGDTNRFRLFSVKAKDVRGLGLACEHKPVEGNYAHAEISGTETNKKSSQLAKIASYVSYPQAAASGGE